MEEWDSESLVESGSRQIARETRDLALNKSRLDEVQEELLEKELRRKARLEAIDNYIRFSVLKLSGFTALIVGVSEFIVPDFLPITLNDPRTIWVTGLALLVGKGATDIMNKLLVEATKKWWQT